MLINVWYCPSEELGPVHTSTSLYKYTVAFVLLLLVEIGFQWISVRLESALMLHNSMGLSYWMRNPEPKNGDLPAVQFPPGEMWNLNPVN